MTKKILFAVMVLPAGLSLFAQNTAPPWYMDKELQYPSRSYIAAVGEGKSRADAEAAAVANVSLFFNTRADVRNEAIREFNEAVTNNTTAFSGKTYTRESAVIRSQTEFLGIRFASPWQDSKTGQWAALAYIERREAAGIYESRISANMASINALAQDADQEKEVFYICALLSKAITIGNLTEELVKIAVMVDSGTREKYASIPVQIGNLRTKYRSLRDSLSFGIQASGADDSGRIELTLRELFEQQGFVINSRNPMYQASVKLNMNEEKGTEYFFMRPGLTVSVERSGKTLFSYSKNYPRSSHTTLEGAYNRGIIAVEKDLKENFIKQLTASIGR
jgi:hypothetical protein